MNKLPHVFITKQNVISFKTLTIARTNTFPTCNCFQPVAAIFFSFLKQWNKRNLSIAINSWYDGTFTFSVFILRSRVKEYRCNDGTRSSVRSATHRKQIKKPTSNRVIFVSPWNRKGRTDNANSMQTSFRAVDWQREQRVKCPWTGTDRTQKERRKKNKGLPL